MTKKNIKFALLGGGYNICSISRILINLGYPKPVLVTHPKAAHQRDINLYGSSDIYQNVFNVSQELGIQLIEAETVNNKDLIASLKELGCTAAFSLSCRSIIKKEFIQAFEGKVYNIHPSVLPQEKGGGVFSWRIMNGDNKIAATVHLIDEGIDTGDILFQESYQSKIKPMNVYQMIKETNALFDKLLCQFLENIESLKPTNQTQGGTYLPRLYTEINGAVDWSWSRDNIDLFIRAFSFPYPGAFTFINNKKKIHLLEAEPLENKSFHPFMSGRILDITNSHVDVVTQNGPIRIYKVRLADTQEVVSPITVLKETDLLNTPLEHLEIARTSIISVKNM